MHIKYCYSLFFTLTFFISHAQQIHLKSAKYDLSEWERILAPKNILVQDTVAIKKYVKPLQNRNSDADKVLYNLLLANSHAEVFDGVNDKSNRFFSQSIRYAKNLDNNALEIWAMLCYAEYYYNYRKMTKAFPFFVAAIEKIEETDPTQILFPRESFTKIGFYMGTIGNKKEAVNYLKKALQYADSGTAEFATINDCLGFYYLELGDLVNARKNVLKASEVSKSVGDSLRYAKSLGNLALISEKTKNYPQAIQLLHQDIQISERLKCEQNTMFAYTALARLYITTNQIRSAEQVLKKADVIAKSKPYFKINELEILKLKLEIIYKQKRGGEELAVRRRIGILEDSLNKTEGVLPLNQVNWMMQKRNFEQNIDSTKQQLLKESFIKNLILGTSVLLIILVVFVVFYSKYRLKRKQKQNERIIKEFEQTTAHNERKLADVHKTLDSQIVFLREKNIQIQKLHKEIDKIRKTEPFAEPKIHQNLEDLLQSHLMTEENWRNFKTEFHRTHPDFYNNLIENFPEITDSNLRIILLQKLGFTNGDISGLLGITVDAVKKSKQRLKRKLGDKHDLLFTLIAVES